MAVTFALNASTIASSNGGTQADYVTVGSSSDVYVITFSDGIRIAISNYNDPDGTPELVVGTPTPIGATDTVNLELLSTGNNTSFTVYDYGSGTLGTALYTYNGGSNAAA
jgi:hypothetical protein